MASEPQKSPRDEASAEEEHGGSRLPETTTGMRAVHEVSRRYKAIRKDVSASRRRFRSRQMRGPLKRAFWTVIEILNTIRAQFSTHRVTQRAAGVAFFTVLGFVPAIMMLVVLADRANLTGAAGQVIIDTIIDNYIPLEREQAMATLGEWVNNARTTIAGGVGLVIALLAAFNVFSGYYTLINDLWEAPQQGRFTHKIRSAALFFFVAPIILAASAWLGSSLIVQTVPNEISGPALSYGLIFFAAFAGLKAITLSPLRTSSALFAALFGAAAFELAKYGFGFYVREILQGSWFQIYGAIFLLPVFLLWNFVTAVVIALTSSLAWALQHHKELLFDEEHEPDLQARATAEEARQRRDAEPPGDGEHEDFA